MNRVCVRLSIRIDIGIVCRGDDVQETSVISENRISKIKAQTKQKEDTSESKKGSK